MDLARVLQALKNADAAGDTTAARQLAQVAQQMSQPAQPAAPEFKRDYTTGEMLSKAVTRGTKRIGSAFGDLLPAMGASALGFNEYAQRQLGEAAETEAEIEQKYAPQYRGTQDVTGLGSALGFAAETVAEQVPNIATALVPGLGAGAIAARAGAGLAGRAAAVNAGTFLGSYSQAAPEVFQNIYETSGKMEPGVAALFGAGSAALDSILPAQLAKSITGPLKAGIIEKVLEKSGMDKGLLRSVTAGMAKGVGAEGLTEGAQEGINIAAERFVAENPEVFGSKEWDRIMQSAVKGAIAGGAFGGVGGGVEAARAGAERREAYAQALEERGDRQAAAEVRRQSAEIEAAQAQDPQQSLPGFEMGPATGLMPTAEPTAPESKSPKSTQAEMFTAEGELAPGMTKLADKDDKAAANRERQAQQREAAQIKEDQKALKDALAGLTATPKNLVDLAKQPSPIQQTIMQAQGEMDALAAKRGPKVQSAPPLQAQPTTTSTVTPAAPVVTTAAPAVEPVVIKAPEPLTIDTLPPVIGADKDGLKAFGKTFGIGPTAKILRADGPLAGKDISDPAQAAEVRTVLETYASGKPAVGAAEKIEAYLKRPEFQGAQNVAGPVTEPVGASPELADAAGPIAAPGPIKAPERGGVVSAGEPAEAVAGGEGSQPRALTEEPVAQKVQLKDGNNIAIAPEASPDAFTNLVRMQYGEPVSLVATNVAGEEVGRLTYMPNGGPIDVFVEPSARRQGVGTALYGALESAGGKLPAEDSGVIISNEARAVRAKREATSTETTGETLGTQAPQTQQAETQGQEPALAKPVGKRAATDIKKAEQGRIDAKREQNEFIAGNDQRVDDILTGRLRALGKEAGLRAKDLPSEKYRDTEAHKMLRLPGLFNEFFRLQSVVAKAQEPNQKAKNAQSLQQVTDAIAATDPNANQMLGALRQMSPQQRDTLISQMNKQGFDAFDVQAKARVAAVKQEKSASRTETDTAQELGDEELEALANTFNERFFQETGKRIFLPKFVGPEFNSTDRDLAAQGNGNALLRNMIDQTNSPAIKHVLRKLRSLNLNTKIVIGPVEGNRSGSYDPATDTITLSPEFGLNAHTLIHEYTHAAISKVLANPNHPLTKQFAKFFDQMQNRLGAAYGAQDLQEFAAELVGNPEFQAVLKSIKTPRSESMFKRIMQSIAEFFGFQPSAFDTGLNFINDAIDISGDVEANAADKMFLGMGDFKAVSNIGNAMPRLAGDMIENTRNALSNARESGVAQAAFGLLRLDNINTLYKKELPSIQTLLNALEKRNGMQEAMIKDVNTKYKDMVKVQQKYPQAMKRVNDIAIDARLKSVDILDPNFKTSPSNINDYQNLKQAFSTLPKEVQDVYRTIRKDYENSLDAYEKVLLDAAGGVSPSLAKRLTLQFQTRKRVVAYVPFLRQGDFWVEYADPATGERTATSFESFRQRQQFTDQMLTPKGIQFKNYQNLQDIRFGGESLPPTHFLAEVMAGLKQQGATQAQIDSVYQSYLTLFPGESIVKQFMKSKNVLGMDRDIVRGYGDVMVRWARKLSNSEYIPQIDNAVSEISAQAQNANDPTITAAAQNILDQSEFFHNPNFNTFVNTATTASYFMYMAGNISSALINLTSLPMLVWPMIGGKFGFDKATTAMINAGKVATNDWSKNPKYKNLYNTLTDHAQLEHTMARELLEGRRQTTDEFNSLKAKILDGLSIPLAVTEKYNRATTAIAAYDLAKQSGMNENDAVQYALTTVKDVHTSGLAATGPKWMQTGLGRMFFTFKSFVWNSAFIMARAFHQAYAGESPAVRKAAQRQLIGTVGMATVFAGAKGLPFYGAASTLATMIAALFGDDDEPFDFDTEMREFFGEALYKGAFNYVTNLELANRAGIATDLLFRDDPKGVAEHGYVLSALQQAIGPIGSIAVNTGNAFNMFSDGNVGRAIETLSPSFLRNGIKGTRYLVEGATTLKGDPVMEDISAYNSLMQVIGFSPADLSSTYEKVSAAKGYEREVNARRVKLLQLYDMAQHAGDTEMMGMAREKIAEFNEAVPAKRITGDTLRRSIAARAAAEKDMINGVRFDKKLRPEIEAKFFDDEE
jgi:GNAT superfamily N-acetyltransferase